VRLKGIAVWALRIPFVEAFRHSAKDRTACDSIVVRVEDDCGEIGFGEGVPRPYVTGETAESMVRHLTAALWPAIADRPIPDLNTAADLAAIDGFMPELPLDSALSDNASRCALELAILDCALRRQNRAMTSLLPPARQKVTYSGVITSGSLEKALQHARQMKQIGLRQIKVKVGFEDDVERIRAIRSALGEDAALRLDANGAWSPDRALEVLWAVAACRIDSVEQPLARGPITDLAAFKKECPVPVMVDESLVTRDDARALIAADAVDYFNIRISKCGGLSRSLEIASLAREAGVGIQVGSQVGETAILAAAGRHVAGHLEEVAFVEGSFGTLLLSEDISPDGVRFGHKGEAPVLTGKGLGVRVLEDRLAKYAVKEVIQSVTKPTVPKPATPVPIISTTLTLPD
jgi:muconate cycloisomerase